MATREQIVEEARKWLGSPWKHAGRGPGGLDCAGVPIVTAQALDLGDGYDFINYDRRPDGTFLRRFMEGGCTRKLVSEAEEGDILIFAESGVLCHCGIRTTKYDQPAVIHAHALRRMVIEETLEQAVSVVGKPTHAFQLPGVEEE